jgi:hypothetical protein
VNCSVNLGTIIPKHDHHKAAAHHDEAAKSHRQAAEAHEAGDTEHASQHSQIAHDHSNKAQEASNIAHQKTKGPKTLWRWMAACFLAKLVSMDRAIPGAIIASISQIS